MFRVERPNLEPQEAETLDGVDTRGAEVFERTPTGCWRFKGIGWKPPSPEDYLPKWLSQADDLFLKEEQWRLLYALGCNPGWPENWQRGLMVILDDDTFDPKWATPEADVLSCIELLGWEGTSRKTGKALTSRSAEFTRSFRTQLVEWLETPAESREFPSPFSMKQWKKCIRKWGYSALKERVRATASKLRVDDDNFWPLRCEDLVPNLLMS